VQQPVDNPSKEQTINIRYLKYQHQPKWAWRKKARQNFYGIKYPIRRLCWTKMGI